jgi:hypothetical protein
MTNPAIEPIEPSLLSTNTKPPVNKYYRTKPPVNKYQKYPMGYFLGTAVVLIAGIFLSVDLRDFRFRDFSLSAGLLFRR